MTDSQRLISLSDTALASVNEDTIRVQGADKQATVLTRDEIATLANAVNLSIDPVETEVSAEDLDHIGSLIFPAWVEQKVVSADGNTTYGDPQIDSPVATGKDNARYTCSCGEEFHIEGELIEHLQTEKTDEQQKE